MHIISTVELIKIFFLLKIHSSWDSFLTILYNVCIGLKRLLPTNFQTLSVSDFSSLGLLWKCLTCFTRLLNLTFKSLITVWNLKDRSDKTILGRLSKLAWVSVDSKPKAWYKSSHEPHCTAATWGQRRRSAIEAFFHSRPAISDLRGARNVVQYLARSLVGAHLQADGALVHRGLDLSFGVVEVPPGAVRIHPRLTGTLVGAHLKTKYMIRVQTGRGQDSDSVAQHLPS